MKSLHWNLRVLLFFLNASPLLHSILSAHAASTSSPISRRRINYVMSPKEDDETTTAPPVLQQPSNIPIVNGEPELCHYDPCLENQEPCLDLSERTRCLCPGISRDNVPPEAPRIHFLTPINHGKDQGKVEVQWCAPSSVVSKYRVMFQGVNRQPLEFQASARRGSVGQLDAGVKICVEAVNKAGHSVPTEFSCQRYDPLGSSDKSVLAGVIGGGVALILILIVVTVSIKKCKSCQKVKTNSADGLGNPSYNKEGMLWFCSKGQTNPAGGSAHRDRTFFTSLLTMVQAKEEE